MEQLMHMGGFLESWQTELQELLASLSSEHQRHRTTRKKLHFRLQNCIDACQETNRLSYMALPKNVIINIPIVASVVADVPFDKENAFFEVEVLTMSEKGTIVIGAVSKDFQPGYQPGAMEHSTGYSIADGSFRNGSETSCDPSVICCVGDKVGCGLDFKEENQPIIYFTKNGNKVFEVPLSNDDQLEDRLRYPAISMTTPKEEVHLLQESPWRSATQGSDNREGLKLCRETGQLSFRSTKEGGRETTLLANLPFSKQFAYFEIEIRALGEEDEISIGGVPEDYSLRKLPGRRPRSLGYHGRVGGIFPGIDIKRDDAPKCNVGDKMGCGIEFRANGKRHLYFTHNSQSFMEAELNENCPSNLYPAIGMRSHGGTVCICLLDCSKWGSADDDAGMKPIQVDMTSKVDPEPGVVVVDKETARASYTAPVGVTRDAILVSSDSLTIDGGCSYFEIEILYGNILTIGLVPRDAAASLTVHPGWTDSSIGYNAESGQVYRESEAMKMKQMKATYGDRIGCGIKKNLETDDDDKLLVYFKKNGAVVCEMPFGNAGTVLSPVIGMRSAGQVLSIRLLDRLLWSCDVMDPVKNNEFSGLTREVLDRELIECPICRDIFTDPRILPCSIHSFCAECLRKYIEQHQGKRSVPCPICQKLFVVPSGGVNELPTNPLITRLLELRNKLEGN